MSTALVRPLKSRGHEGGVKGSLLGEAASRAGRVLDFDPETGMVVDDDEADALLTKVYREPWGFED